MHKRTILPIVATILGLLLTAGCEAIVEEYDVNPCNPEEPKSCADLGDTDAQRIGCCSSEGDAFYYCNNGVVSLVSCGEKTCDYDPSKDIMTCVE